MSEINDLKNQLTGTRTEKALEAIVAELAGLGETMIIISQQLADLQDRI